MSAAKPKKFNGKVITGLVLVLVALIFVAVAMFGSWWDYKASGSGGGLTVDATLGFGLNQICLTGTVMGISASACGAYSGGAPVPGSSGATPVTNIQNVMGLGNILVILGLLMAILTLILIFVGAGKPKLRMLVMLFGIIGAIVLLVAFAYVYVSLPGAVDKDMAAGSGAIPGFFGSMSAAGVNVTWGGGIGWYMALIGFILLLVGALIAMAGMKPQPAQMTPMPPPM